MEPPFLVFRDRTQRGHEVITAVPLDELYKRQAAARQLMWMAMRGDEQAKKQVEAIFAMALSSNVEERGDPVIAAFLMREALKEWQQMQSAQTQPQTQPQPHTETHGAPQSPPGYPPPAPQSPEHGARPTREKEDPDVQRERMRQVGHPPKNPTITDGPAGYAARANVTYQAAVRARDAKRAGAEE